MLEYSNIQYIHFSQNDIYETFYLSCICWTIIQYIWYIIFPHLFVSKYKSFQERVDNRVEAGSRIILQILGDQDKALHELYIQSKIHLILHQRLLADKIQTTDQQLDAIKDPCFNWIIFGFLDFIDGITELSRRGFSKTLVLV